MAAADETIRRTARDLLSGWKGGVYAFGPGCVGRVGPLAAEVGGAGAGPRAVLVANGSAWMASTLAAVEAALAEAGVQVVARTAGARPNSPRDDVYRMQDAIAAAEADLVVAVGGGSTIDAAKAGGVLATLAGPGHDIEPFFGVGRVGEALAKQQTRLPAFVAVQNAAGSAAHLTRYSNITDPATAQKKLIIDDACVPAAAVFDYALTRTAPADLTMDGAFDGIGHLAEAYFGATGATLGRLEPIAEAGAALIVSSIARAVEAPGDLPAREALGLGTDLGGYAIMLGSTNGPHLNSFSLVDLLAHGRACAVLLPYYTVLFAPAIERQLRVLGRVYATAGLIDADLDRLGGRDLATAVAEGMMALSRRVGFPTALGEVPGFGAAHVARALAAAKDPQLASKLQGMPVSLAPEQVDEVMGSVLAAATDGDLGKIADL